MYSKHHIVLAPTCFTIHLHALTLWVQEGSLRLSIPQGINLREGGNAPVSCGGMFHHLPPASTAAGPRASNSFPRFSLQRSHVPCYAAMVKRPISAWLPGTSCRPQPRPQQPVRPRWPSPSCLPGTPCHQSDLVSSVLACCWARDPARSRCSVCPPRSCPACNGPVPGSTGTPSSVPVRCE